MEKGTEMFGMFKGKQVYRYTLENKKGLKISVLSQGGILYEVSIPTQNGRRNLVLNYPKINDYYENPFYVCMLIGLVAGRLSHGKFFLNSKEHYLQPNEGMNLLHGGKYGFSNANWDGKIVENKIVLKHSFGSETGFPGNVNVVVQYSLNEENEISVLFEAETDEDTLFNPTLHVYWNLSSAGTIKDHNLKINSNEHLELAKDKLPTGRLLTNSTSPFDFSTSSSLGEAIDNLQTTKEKGFDDIFLVKPEENNLIATLNTADISVDLCSDRNGLVLFTANSFTDDMKLTLGSGHPWMGVATEAQNLPDGINQSNFPNNDILFAGKPRTERITYKVNF